MAKKTVKKKVLKNAPEAAAERPDQPAQPEETTTLTVRARQPRRMRAGILFTDQPQAVTVTAAQRAAIEADPVLEIVAEP